jgi:diguanylate cyclase (GGDEF)-like protein
MSPRTILIIEDSKLMREALSATIGDLGDVVLAVDGRSGLEKALEIKPSVILLDIVLPDIDGFTVCEGLKKDDRTKHIPVIIMTGLNSTKAELKGLALGAADFFRKPFESEIVRARVRTQLELVKAREELVYMAMVDPLTSCFNRRHFMNAADVELSRRKRHSYGLVVAVLDVDHFKKINDTYGHEAGDLVLKEIANCCKDTVRFEDTLGRIGGEEFAVLLPEADVDGAYAVLERMREKIAGIKYSHNGHIFQVTVSIGLTEVEYKDVAINNALDRADQALYQAKSKGRDTVIIN